MKTLNISIDRAREWYNGSDEALRRLALEYYSVDELKVVPFEEIKSIYDANIPIVGYINYTSAIAPDGNTGFVLAAAHCAIFISLTGSIYGLTSGHNWEKKN